MAKEAQQQDQQQSKKDLQQKQEASKKWKGKDWFSILTPNSFGGRFLAETPSTDPTSVIGRTIDVPASFLFEDKTKNHMKVSFRVTGVKDKSANTEFSGFFCNREFIYRNIRKRTHKFEVIGEVTTKDNWLLQVTIIAILNRNTETSIQSKARKFLLDAFSEEAKNATVEDFVRTIVSGGCQKRIRKDCSKIYPLRFAEVSKIEVVKSGLAAEAGKNN